MPAIGKSSGLHVRERSKDGVAAAVYNAGVYMLYDPDSQKRLSNYTRG